MEIQQLFNRCISLFAGSFFYTIKPLEVFRTACCLLGARFTKRSHLHLLEMSHLGRRSEAQSPKVTPF